MVDVHVVIFHFLYGLRHLQKLCNRVSSQTYDGCITSVDDFMLEVCLVVYLRNSRHMYSEGYGANTTRLTALHQLQLSSKSLLSKVRTPFAHFWLFCSIVHVLTGCT